MRRNIFAFALVSLLCVLKADGRPDSIGEIVDSLKSNFGALSSKRDQWFQNYNVMKKLANADQENLNELMLISKLALPMIWSLYSSEVESQKKRHTVLVNEDLVRSLPYHRSFSLEYPFFHMEMTLQLQEESDFQIELLRDESTKIFLLRINYDDRRIVFSNLNEEGENVERFVLEEGDFPAIKPNEDFRVNFQVADDCTFVSFWVGDLSLETPMPLPAKHHWCSKVYHHSTSYSINVMDLKQMDSSHESESAEDNHDVKLMFATIYGGLILQ
ncbi:uncharacterized protein [Palaemon carinicauda]|uniref:uncharacterized protein isoform X2 n=1 Tax=Palaemon carinicauda TaxID=392227 RepID=UPI0035B65377